ncbi:MAG: DUF3883 domain-containing protein [Pseudomonadota bacterium]
MTCNYDAIRRDNERRYGTDIGRIGPMLLADRYDDRTHFIFELLQNAEDALARRTGWQGPRSVRFHLTRDALQFGHFGQPFDEADVRGICGIGESTKDLTAIGRFGIGFKSVYALTDRPEIHSGREDFAIENFVWPITAPSRDRDADETVILIPLKFDDEATHKEVVAGLERLGASTLLFLREIEEVQWSVEGGRSGIYLRESKEIDQGVRRVTVVGHEREEAEVDEEWLIFSRPVLHDGRSVGHVEIAFSIVRDEKSKTESLRALGRSPLVVYFPTVVETHLGFLIQGPYRTTPSRDNVPQRDPWNQGLIGETASLLSEALRWLRDHNLLDTMALRCLPIEPTKFADGTMFAPMFAATKEALISDPLLPCLEEVYMPASRARLARTQEVRELFAPAQLAALFDEEQELHWLTGEITQDRSPELRRYVMQELGVLEVTAESIVARLDKDFLEAQPDDWIRSLYGFLSGQRALRRQLMEVPLIRLEDGSHVPARANGQSQAFLPSTIRTGFPTVRAAVCSSDAAREFLQSLGLTEPDPVDDVIWNVLPKYEQDKLSVSSVDYDSDLQRVLTAFATDSKVQKDKLIAALRQTAFVIAVDAGNGVKRFARPEEVYLATDRLKQLFAEVADVLLVDDSHGSLRGEEVRELLEACGAVRYLRPIPSAILSWEEREKLRAQAGHPETSGYNDRVADWTLNGLKELLSALPHLETGEQGKKAGALWEELSHLEERRGKGIFTGEYTWTHYGRYRATFDAGFVKELNERPWVPDGDGGLQSPSFVLFDSLGWKPNPFLQSKIRFRPPLIEELAREAGIEPAVLDLLKSLGVTSEAELRRRLKIEEPPPKEGDGGADKDVRSPEHEGMAGEGNGKGKGDEEKAGDHEGDGRGTRRKGNNQDTENAEDAGLGSNGSPREGVGGRPHVFISYVGAHPDEEEPDPDGLDAAARMNLEAQAVDLILSQEPFWQRTPPNNPGYDLFEAGEDGSPARLCEVKAMKGGLQARPAGLSRTQFECAREHGKAYWLYVVEHAGTDGARLVRIQDPAGRARTFTFDHGWLDIADVDAE